MNTKQTLNISGYLETIRNISNNLVFLKLRTQNNRTNNTRKIQLVVKEPAELLDQVKKIPRQSFMTVFSDEKQSTANESWVLKKIIEVNRTVEIPPVDLGQKQTLSEALDVRAIKNRSELDHKLVLARAFLYNSIRKYLDELNFVEYDSPKMSESCSESGADLFEVNNCADGKKRYLIQSPQLYKQRLINAGFEKVYEIAHIFRNEKFNTSRHLFETTCLDVEMSTARTTDLIPLITNLIIRVSDQMHKEFGLIAYKNEDFCVLTYAEALKLVNSEKMDRQAEKKLFEKINTKFIYVTNYPNSERPFYTSGDTGFDLLHAKGELISGSTRITDFVELKRCANLKNVDLDCMVAYKESFKLGCAPSSGFALGLDRFLMVLLDKNCVQETLFFN